jgi:hypothetical protein
MRHENSGSVRAVLAFMLGIALLPYGADAVLAPSTGRLGIASVSVQGTNLLFEAAIPPGIQHVAVEMRPSLKAAWVKEGFLDVPPGADEISFAVPKPPSAMAFFRLKAIGTVPSATLVSDALQYVVMPSLSSTLEDSGDAVFHFKGLVDGSDRILITRQGALWHHVNWAWPPDPVAVNGVQWNPQDKNYLTTVGRPGFLPESFSLESARLETIQGRDVVAMERAKDALVVYLDDTPVGPGIYEFKIHFPPAGTPAPEETGGVAASLKIAAQVDGSDCIKITPTEAFWEHRAWACPKEVVLNDVHWSRADGNVLKNEGATTFLPSGVDLSTARIVGRKGRDLATMWADKNAVWVWFADNANGTDAYELDISFGQ